MDEAPSAQLFNAVSELAQLSNVAFAHKHTPSLQKHLSKLANGNKQLLNFLAVHPRSADVILPLLHTLCGTLNPPLPAKLHDLAVHACIQLTSSSLVVTHISYLLSSHHINGCMLVDHLLRLSAADIHSQAHRFLSLVAPHLSLDPTAMKHADELVETLIRTITEQYSTQDVLELALKTLTSLAAESPGIGRLVVSHAASHRLYKVLVAALDHKSLIVIAQAFLLIVSLPENPLTSRLMDSNNIFRALQLLSTLAVSHSPVDVMQPTAVIVRRLIRDTETADALTKCVDVNHLAHTMVEALEPVTADSDTDLAEVTVSRLNFLTHLAGLQPTSEPVSIVVRAQGVVETVIRHAMLPLSGTNAAVAYASAEFLAAIAESVIDSIRSVAMDLFSVSKDAMTEILQSNLTLTPDPPQLSILKYAADTCRLAVVAPTSTPIDSTTGQTILDLCERISQLILHRGHRNIQAERCLVSWAVHAAPLAASNGAGPLGAADRRYTAALASIAGRTLALGCSASACSRALEIISEIHVTQPHDGMSDLIARTSLAIVEATTDCWSSQDQLRREVESLKSHAMAHSRALAELDEARHLIQRTQAEVQFKDDEHTTTLAELETARNELRQSHAQLMEMQGTLNETRLHAENEMESITMLSAELDRERSVNERLRAELDNMKQSNDSLTESLESVQSKEKEMSGTLAMAVAEANRLAQDAKDSETRVSVLEEALEGTQVELRQARSAFEDERRMRSLAEGEVGRLRPMIGRLERENVQAKERTAELENKMAELTRQVADLRGVNQNLSGSLAAAKLALNESNESLWALQMSHTDAKAALARAEETARAAVEEAERSKSVLRNIVQLGSGAGM
ncbi:Chromosome partition protein Smc [Carpediemonas membranifera]|uniref:Chromosome partition protein Smc n=1 Tax=Carpediemonas membranifera TaxID=201153 RepID=A0A8J6AVJ6_9EUKA|nr:Chromosome partition protein Smc [Carpediemonas membranifera]|eukprot:KAG9395866.1 Chromosome partition protein Smc [Carpediemonas membranifera]